MPKLATPIVPINIDRYKPKAAQYTVPDGNGLYLLVLPSGVKSWQVRYRTQDGKGRRVVIGDYPAMSLADARIRAAEVHADARTGNVVVGVRLAKQMQRAQRSLEELEQERLEAEAKARSFTVLSEKWLTLYQPTVVESTYNKARLIVRDYLQPVIGAHDMATLSRLDVAPIIKSMGERVPSLAGRVPWVVNQVVEYAISHRLRPEYTELNLRSVTRKLPKGGKQPAVVNEVDLAKLMRAIQGYENYVVRNALMLCAWTAHRPGIIATARWSEIDLDRAEWIVPGIEEGKFKGDGTPRNRMKMGVEHVVSLPRQAVAMLREMHKVSGGSEYVFPAVGKTQNPHIHRDALSKAIRLMGFQGRHTTHGFRSSLRTVARERLGVDSEELEAQLAHTSKSANGDSYNRTSFTNQRIKIMQTWADYLDQLVVGAKVIPIDRAVC